jgi:hypothetical protein
LSPRRAAPPPRSNSNGHASTRARHQLRKQ